MLQHAGFARLSIELALLVVVGACRPDPGQTTAPSTPVDAAPETAPELLVCKKEIMAIIGNEAIPMSRHEEVMALKLQKYADRGRDIPASAEIRYRRSIAKRVIYQELLAREIEALDIGDYDPAELAKRELGQREGIEDWPKHLRRRGESEATLREMYIAELREKLIISKRGTLEVTAQDIDDEYERLGAHRDASVDRVRAWSILIEIDPQRFNRTTMAEVRAEAERIAGLARNPDIDLDWLASRPSSAPASGAGVPAGDMGFVNANDMPKEWSLPVFKAKLGEVLLIEIQNGVYVVKVEGHWGPGPLPLDEFEADTSKRLAARKLSAARRELKAELLERYEPIDCEEERLGPDPRPSEDIAD